EDGWAGRGGRGYVQEHRGTAVLVLGILALVGIVPIVLGPIAWIMGSNDLKEMRAGRMDRSGQGNTETGKMLGMIGTILWGIVTLGCCSFYIIGLMGMGAAGAFR